MRNVNKIVILHALAAGIPRIFHKLRLRKRIRMRLDIFGNCEVLFSLRKIVYSSFLILSFLLSLVFSNLGILSSSIIEDRNDKIERKLICVALDISKQKEIENELDFLAHHDALTQLANKMDFDELIQKEISRSNRMNLKFALFYIDLDGFKDVNDKYGHQCGDEVLKQFVKIISELIRHDTDWLARYGGEEFLLVLPETNLANAFSLANRLRKHIAGKVIETEAGKISITASFGVSGFNASRPAGSITQEAMISAVDKYLYEAKEKGRNRVISGPLSGST